MHENKKSVNYCQKASVSAEGSNNYKLLDLIYYRSTLALSEQEHLNLLSAINFCFNSFADRLQEQYSTLTQEDIYVCSLLRMGVSNQNMTILLGTNESSSLDDFLFSY